MLERKHISWIILALFFMTGATALVYEVVWSKFLAQMLGSTVQAQTVVLAVFMGGLALGNRLFGKRSGTMLSPLLTYGMLELGIGMYAVVFVYLYRAADASFVALGQAAIERHALLLGLKTVLSVALLLTPTIFMGGTLPLLAAWLQRDCDDAGRRSARFYAINSLGAVLGSCLAGFYLVRNWGMVATLQAAGLLNAFVGATAMLLARLQNATPPAAESVLKCRNTSAPTPTCLRWACLMVALTGGVSMGLEVLASRSLVLIFGSSLQSFAVVLMAFILGIGLGSTAMSSPRLRRWQSEVLVVFLLSAAAAWIGIVVFKIEVGVDFYRIAQSGVGRTEVGYFYYQALTAAFSMLVLGLPAALIGSVLPLLIRTATRQQIPLGEEVGRLLTWNTLGAVIGVVLTGFFIMPAAGLRGAFGVLALVLCLVALLAAWRGQAKRWVVAPVVVAAFVGGTLAFGGEGWRHVMSSGVFRNRERDPDLQYLTQRKKHVQIRFYEDAPDATVSVEEGKDASGSNVLSLRINGKPDAATRGDLSTQLLVGHLPLLARPKAKDVFLLGMGSGITAGAVLAHPVQRLDLAENCRPVLRAAELFAQWNRGVLTNPVVKIWQEDARTVLKLNRRLYDVIIFEPSNPWVVGVGSVFSRECYELAATRLKPGGIMVQWFHVYEMHDEIVRLVLRTFLTVFPHAEIWDTGVGDVILLGAYQPWPSSVELFRTAWQRAPVQQDMGSIGVHSPAALFARRMASQETSHAVVGDGPIQQDWFPILEYAAPQAFFVGLNSTVLAAFDERTWQSWLAPADTRRVLERLSDDELKAEFREYGSVNPALLARLRQGFPRDQIAGNPPQAALVDTTPCVFSVQPSEPYLPPEASEETRRLQAARTMIEANGDRVGEGIELIESLVRNWSPSAKWAPGGYVALAAKASHALGNRAKAQNLIQLGLEQQPQHAELLYLRRVLTRPRTATEFAESSGR